MDLNPFLEEKMAGAVTILLVIGACATLTGAKLFFDSENENLATLVPVDPEATIGENFSMYCNLKTEHPWFENRFGPGDMFFNVSGTTYTVESPEFTVLNETTARVTFITTLQNHHSFIECGFFKENGDLYYIGQQYMWTGWKPHQATLRSLSMNEWGTIRITWDKPLNMHYVTRVSAWWKPQHEDDGAYKVCFYEREKLKSPEQRLCRVDKLFNSTGEKIVIKFNSTNIAGSTETPPQLISLRNFTFHTDEVENLKSAVLSPQTILVTWDRPSGKDYEPPNNLVYRVEYIGGGDTEMKVNYTEDTAIVLEDLQFSSIYYVFVSCKTKHAEYWSEKKMTRTTFLDNEVILQPNRCDFNEIQRMRLSALYKDVCEPEQTKKPTTVAIPRCRSIFGK